MFNFEMIDKVAVELVSFVYLNSYVYAYIRWATVK